MDHFQKVWGRAEIRPNYSRWPVASVLSYRKRQLGTGSWRRREERLEELRVMDYSRTVWTGLTRLPLTVPV